MCNLKNVTSHISVFAFINSEIFSDEAMIRLTNAAIQNHHNLQFPLITDDIVSLTDTENSDVKRKTCC